MSKLPPFEPLLYAEELAATGNFACSNRLMYAWNGTHWSMIDDLEANRKALHWLAKTRAGIVKAPNAKIAHETALLWLPPLPALKNLAVIPLKNGYLHLHEESGPELKKHDKALGIEHVIDCNYEPTAPAPAMFSKFLEQILPDETVRARVQEYVGYTLLPDARFQVAQIWIGSGANGKGTLANIVQALHVSKSAVAPNKLDGFHAAAALGASLLYCDEAPPADWCEQVIKSMIAGESVAIDRKYLPPITTRILGKWLILGNHIPAVKDQSAGFWRRFDIIPFPVQIPAAERDPMLAEKVIKDELAGVLNWALEGLARLLKRGRFDPCVPIAMQAATQSAKLETNSIHAWVLDQEIARTTTVTTPKSEVYALYTEWARSNGMCPVSSPKFWKRLPDSIGTIDEGRIETSSGRLRSCNVQLP